eukprot:c12803_g6_i1.p1 GENE.c12803_g6_i1~~c12803_g6_i1.p1  ORF type:complete len:831 (+),score=242.69 c12803_g6_i1:233-2725(+)
MIITMQGKGLNTSQNVNVVVSKKTTRDSSFKTKNADVDAGSAVEQPTLPKFDRWSEMEIPRRNFLYGLALLCGVQFILRTALDPDLYYELIILSVLFLSLASFPRLRNDARVMGGVVAILCVAFVVVCIAIIVYLQTSSTFWFAFELCKGRKTTHMLGTSLQLVSVPIIFMVWATRTGFPVVPFLWVGLGLTISGTVALGWIAWSIEGFSTDLRCLVVIWGLVPTILTALLLFDSDVQLRNSRLMSFKAEVAAQNQLLQQKIAAANQQKIVGYIFHEVRNPINNITLASELALDLLTPPKRNATSNTIDTEPSIMSAHTHALQRSESSVFHAPSSSTTPFLAVSAVSAVSSSMPRLPSSSDSDPSVCLNDWRLSAVALGDIREMVDDIHQSTQAAVRVLNDALNLQKLQSGAFEFVHNPFKLEDLLVFTLRMAQPQMRRKRIQISEEIDEPLKGVIVDGDFHRLQQVLLNYLNNAYKFTPVEGKIHVKMQHMWESACGAERVVSVRTSVFNTGDGIKKEDRGKIFQPWSQLRAGEQQQEQGSGLGLALCKAFVEKGHSGKVGFDSEVGKGTEFYFSIPFRITELADEVHKSLGFHNTSTHGNTTTTTTSDGITFTIPEPKPSPQVARQRPPSNHQQQLLQQTDSDVSVPRVENGENGGAALLQQTQSGVSGNGNASAVSAVVVDVLVVEDSMISRKLVAKTLRNMGVTFDQCVDGKEAVEKLEANNQYCSVILMDKEMPRMDGFEATAQIRKLGFQGAIVGCTGNAMDDQVAEFLKIGANHVLGKPITQAALRSTLEHFGVLVATSSNNNNNSNNMNNNNNNNELPTSFS